MQRPTTIMQRDRIDGLFQRSRPREKMIAKVLGQLTRQQRMIVLWNQPEFIAHLPANHAERLTTDEHG